MTSWFSFCCLKQWFLKPVSKFWDLQNLSTFQIFLFFWQLSRSFLMFVCLSFEKWPALASLSRKKALVLGRPGIRNSPIVTWHYYVTDNLFHQHSRNKTSTREDKNTVLLTLRRIDRLNITWPWDFQNKNTDISKSGLVWNVAWRPYSDSWKVIRYKRSMRRSKKNKSS